MKKVYLNIVYASKNKFYFEEALRKLQETFLKPYFMRTKVPHSVWILVILPYFPWKMSKSMRKKVPHHLWN